MKWFWFHRILFCNIVNLKSKYILYEIIFKIMFDFSKISSGLFSKYIITLIFYFMNEFKIWILKMFLYTQNNSSKEFQNKNWISQLLTSKKYSSKYENRESNFLMERAKFNVYHYPFIIAINSNSSLTEFK